MRDLIPMLLSNPYAVYSVMRKSRPVLHIEELNLWLVFRYADLRAIASNLNFSKDRKYESENFSPLTPEQRKINDGLEKHMLFSEPPDHTRRRQAVARFFNPKTVESLKPMIEQTVDELLDQLEFAGSFDVVNDFARLLPLNVIANVMGLPVEGRPHYRTWTEAILEQNDPTKEPAARRAAFEKLPAMKTFFEELFELRRREPKDDLVTALVTAGGDSALDTEEMVSTCAILMVAGHETIMNTFSNGLLALEEFPEARQVMQSDRALMPTAVEEILRFAGPVHFERRQTVEACTVADVEIPARSVVGLGFASANRDTTVFERADELVLTREKNPHVAFGYSRHFCIGAPLARAELRCAFSRLFTRFPNYTIDRSSVRWRPSVWMRGLETLKLSA